MTPAALLRTVPILARTFGMRGARERAGFELRRRLGAFATEPRAVPATALDAAPPAAWPFVPNAEAICATSPHRIAEQRARRVADGEHEAYRWCWMPRPATAEEWRRHPRTGHEYDAGVPWHRVPHFDATAGDIKDVWEPARFGWAYDLARGWMLTRDDRFAAEFWTSLGTFLDGCPPWRGVQWACGQETAIRALAWLWCEGAMLEAPSSTPARLAGLRRALVHSATRIADGIAYAESQRNNHGISEATGLIAVGARFRESHPSAERWLDEGRRRLERMVLDQFARDGWYIQHSFNYLRLALDQLVVAQRVLAFSGRPLSGESLGRIRAAIGLVAELIDTESGELPNHGANDGAYVLPLSTRSYRDFVPALTAAAAMFNVALPADIPHDAETLAWLGATPPPVAAARAIPRVRVGESGWVHAVTRGARLFARAGRYGSRPGHVDPLHVDVWIDGRPIAVDAGTFRYAAPEPWRNGLADVHVHNTVSIEGSPPALRGPRFLWLRWPSARIVDARLLDDGGVRITLRNDSWKGAGIRHLRTCEVGAHGVLVIDDLSSDTVDDTAVLHWMIDGDGEQVVLASSAECRVIECAGDAESVFGWISPAYGDKRPGTSLRVRVRLSRGAIRLASGFGDRRSVDALEGAVGQVAICYT